MEMHCLEEYYRAMKRNFKERQEKLVYRLKQGQKLKEEEEEWLDGQGNLVNTELLMTRITELPDNSTIQLCLDDMKKLREVVDFGLSQASNVPEKKTALANQKKSDLIKNSNTEASKKKSTSETNRPTDASQKKNPSKTTKAKENKKPDAKSTNKRKADAAKLTPAESGSKISNASYSEKVEVLDWYHKNGRNESKTADHFAQVYPHLRIKQPLLSKWLKAEDLIRENNRQSCQISTKKIQQICHPKVEASLTEWMTQAIHCNLTITGDMIKAKWRDFARLAGIPSDEWLKLSGGWLESFENCHNLKSYRRHGEAASVDINVVELEVERVQKITEEYPLKDIFNMDETGLFYAMPPDTGLAFNQTHGVKGNKTRLTLAITCNADGSEKLPILFIGKYKRPQCFNKKDAREYGYEYYSNGNAWMTGEIFQQWLLSWDSRLRCQKRKILLLLDNFRGHSIPEEGLTQIRVEFFAANLTSHVQPLDAGIIKCLKSHYRKRAIARSISIFSEQKNQISVKDIFNVNQLMAMKMATRAWQNVSKTTISNCWGATKITGKINQGCSDEIEKAANKESSLIERQLDTLEHIGAVLPANRMTIDCLLNPEGENTQAARVWSNEEIFELVKEEGRQEDGLGAMEIEESEPKVALPTKSEMCQMVSKMLLYLDRSNEDENQFGDMIPRLELFQQDLLKNLHFGGRQAGITDYFKKIPQTASGPSSENHPDVV
ncbi:hypothetical protein PSTG_10532 [Puccinia striiformis f. sp. tritici PST-78]|uniref:HTH CENPB-type domain-containing protein n=1 Tax=Puccinia striiformis f. sp. tritici PST-78 TaxID=1165861 RepID=A0A0L0V9Z6_9BASI|nr:hypothetical protein PSTG_10532 [Puccinia striiformis f. sp. tritici PST-78]